MSLFYNDSYLDDAIVAEILQEASKSVHCQTLLFNVGLFHVITPKLIGLGAAWAGGGEGGEHLNYNVRINFGVIDAMCKPKTVAEQIYETAQHEFQHIRDLHAGREDMWVQGPVSPLLSYKAYWYSAPEVRARSAVEKAEAEGKGFADCSEGIREAFIKEIRECYNPRSVLCMVGREALPTFNEWREKLKRRP